MSDPNLPEGVSHRDIDGTIGETFDPNICEHDIIKCENCDLSLANFEFYIEEYDRMKAALNKYGHHFVECLSREPNPFNYSYKKCDCGLDEFLKERQIK